MTEIAYLEATSLLLYNRASQTETGTGSTMVNFHPHTHIFTLHELPTLIDFGQGIRLGCWGAALLLLERLSVAFFARAGQPEEIILGLSKGPWGRLAPEKFVLCISTCLALALTFIFTPVIMAGGEQFNQPLNIFSLVGLHILYCSEIVCLLQLEGPHKFKLWWGLHWYVFTQVIGYLT